MTSFERGVRILVAFLVAGGVATCAVRYGLGWSVGVSIVSGLVTAVLAAFMTLGWAL